MSEKFDEVVDNLKEPNSWIRLVFMIVFGVLLYLITVSYTHLTLPTILLV